MDLSIIKKAIGNFKAIHGRTPTAAEMAQLEKQALRFTQPTSGLRTGISAQPRAAYELATDPNLINPNTARDEFLTKMTTGRTTKGTNLRPITQDITDPSVIKNIEERQVVGNLDEMLPQAASSTPSADYFANQSRAIENEAISGNTLENLKKAFDDFTVKHGRNPNEDELSAAIAEFNPARHQYGEQGISIMSQRPPTAKGMTDWRNQARNEGIEESYLTKRQGNYPQYIQDELTIQRGEIPTSALKEKKTRYKEVEPVDFYIDEEGNAVKIYPTMKSDGGQITPRDMLAQMIVNQVTPQKFADGRKVLSKAAGPAAFVALSAPTIGEMGSQLLSKTPTKALGGAYDLATAFLPLKQYVPLALATYSPELGDATLDAYLAKKAQASEEAINRGFQNYQKASPANKKLKSSDMAVLSNMFPAAPEPETDYLSGFSGFDTK